MLAKVFKQEFSTQSGVYKFFDKDERIIYVGKAKNLKNRLANHWNNYLSNKDIKSYKMIEQVANITTVITENDLEALILESNLIKEHQPKYNVLFRDDKSYPYLMANLQHEFPKLEFYRSHKASKLALHSSKKQILGPFPSAYVLKDSLRTIAKIFQIRSCSDSVFKSRKTPCLEYQIKQCTAPCVGYISSTNYQKDFKNALLFLEGKNQLAIESLNRQMQEKSDKLEFEKAAALRNKISTLRQLQEVNLSSDNSFDVIGFASRLNKTNICLMRYKDGHLFDKKEFSAKNILFADFETAKQEVVKNFLTLKYIEILAIDNRLAKTSFLPKFILIDFKPVNLESLEGFLTQSLKALIPSFKPKIKTARLKEDLSYLNLANSNALSELNKNLIKANQILLRLDALKFELQLDFAPSHLEAFDISHHGGDNTYASCVVFQDALPKKTAYRLFKIQNSLRNDYASIFEAVQRRYLRIIQDKVLRNNQLQQEDLKNSFPDLLIIDGGLGQLNKTIEALTTLPVLLADKLNSASLKALEEFLHDFILNHLLAVAKGAGRKVGLEILHRQNKPPLDLPSDSNALHLINFIRDEAHRFAIRAHRDAAKKDLVLSQLDQIEGIGPILKKNLLLHFGTISQVARASKANLEKVKGINQNLAHRIYSFFN